jgi:sugar phosphate permease
MNTGTNQTKPTTDTSADTSSRATTVARRTVGLLFAAWLVDYIDRLVIVLALPSIEKEFGLNKTEGGLILSAFFIAYAVSQVPGGFIADRFGAKRTMLAALALWSAFTGLTGLAVSFGMLLFVRVLFGITEGIFPGASMKAISERTPSHQRMTANSLMLASNPLGAALAPLVAAPVMIAFGWKETFWVVAGLGLVMAIVMWRALPAPLGAQANSDSVAAAAPKDAARPAAPVIRASDLLRHSMLYRFALMFVGFDLVSWGLVSWVPSYLIQARGVNIAHTAVYTAVPWLAATVSTVAGGLLFDRFFVGRHRWVVIPSMMVTGIMLVLMITSHSTQQFVLFETLGMAFMWLSFMPIFGLPLRMLPASVAGLAGGLVNFGGQFAGALAPFIMGWLADTYGFTAAFSFLLLGVVIAIGASLWTPQRPEVFAEAFGLDAVEQPVM